MINASNPSTVNQFQHLKGPVFSQMNKCSKTSGQSHLLQDRKGLNMSTHRSGVLLLLPACARK